MYGKRNIWNLYKDISLEQFKVLIMLLIFLMKTMGVIENQPMMVDMYIIEYIKDVDEGV